MPKRWRVAYERELAAELWKRGFVPVRVGGSGSGKRTVPALDLFVWDPTCGKLYAVEVKSSIKSADPRYITSLISEKEKEKMRMLRERGVEVVVAVRHNGKWYWFRWENGRLEETEDPFNPFNRFKPNF